MSSGIHRAQHYSEHKRDWCVLGFLQVGMGWGLAGWEGCLIWRRSDLVSWWRADRRSFQITGQCIRLKLTVFEHLENAAFLL